MFPTSAAIGAIVSLTMGLSAGAVLLCFLWSRSRREMATCGAHSMRIPDQAEKGQARPVSRKSDLRTLVLSERAIAERYAQAYGHQHIQCEPLTPDTIDGLPSSTDTPRFQLEPPLSIMPVFPDRVFTKTGRRASPFTPIQSRRRSGNSIGDPFSDLEEIELDDFTLLPFATKESLSALIEPGPRQSHPRGPSYIINGTVHATKPKVSVRKNIGSGRAASPVVHGSRTWCR